MRHIMLGTVLVGGFVAFSLFQSGALTKNSVAGLAQVVGVPSEPFSTESYQQYLSYYTEIIEKTDPRDALISLREEIKTNDSLSRGCHDLAHEIGQKAYEKYGDFGEAMQFQNEICNSGYLHGVIESHFLNVQDIEATMQTTCDAYPIGSFLNWECTHGVGHGLMFFTYNDLPRTLELCEMYGTQFEKTTCVNGAFMENFIVDQESHTSKYVSEEDWWYPCGDQSLRHKSDCYIYAPTYYLAQNENDYQGAFDLCMTAEDKFINTCVAGVGAQIMKENINNPLYAESVCMNGTDRSDKCVRGMIGLYINHNGGLTEARELCTLLTKENSDVCEEVVASRTSLFAN